MTDKISIPPRAPDLEAVDALILDLLDVRHWRGASARSPAHEAPPHRSPFIAGPGADATIGGMVATGGEDGRERCSLNAPSRGPRSLL
jgi:hypothetical protein